MQFDILPEVCRESITEFTTMEAIEALARFTHVNSDIGVAIAIYRLYFHPLSKYPGPFLAKISDIYGAYHNVMGRLHTETERGHQIFAIYYSKDVQKSRGYVTMVPAPGAYNIFTAVDKAIHRHKRKVISQGFSDQCIRDFEPTILSHVDLFLKRLCTSKDPSTGADWSSPFNMTDCCRHLGYDIMGEFGFGQTFHLQTSDENRFLIDAVTATSHKAGVYVQYPELQKLRLEALFYRRGLEMRRKYLELMSNLVKSRLAAGKSSRNDLFSFIVDAKDPETGVGFSEDELWAESRFLLIAGADTSSTALTSLFFYLAAYLECYQKLTEEVRSTFDTPSEIRSGPELSSCQYLRACLDEAMRMSPPISGTLWREVSGDTLVMDGEAVPKGVDVGVNPYAVHHNEDIFPDSFTFKPERWIISSDNPKETVEKARHIFSVFSFGTRACAGRNMAYTELSDTIARVAWYLDLRSADGSLEALRGGYFGSDYGQHREKEFQLREHLTCSHDGPFLRFRVRDGAEEAVATLLEQ
ncbi:cytochrome P450 [Macrophomina phaseolina]|nr:cytochrome P450 [Macrophomina phaseolina]